MKNSTTIQTSKAETEIYSKVISAEQADQVRKLPSGMFQISLLGTSHQLGGQFWTMKNPHMEIKDAELMLPYKQEEIKNLQDYMDNMESHLAYILETDEDSTVGSDGKLHTSSYYDEIKKEKARNRRNTQSRIYRIKSKIAEKNRIIARATVFVSFWDSLPEGEGF